MKSPRGDCLIQDPTSRPNDGFPSMVINQQRVFLQVEIWKSMLGFRNLNGRRWMSWLELSDRTRSLLRTLSDTVILQKHLTFVRN